MTHCRLPSLKPRSCCASGSAMFTTVASSMTMSCAMPMTTSTHQRTAWEPRRPESVFAEAGAPRSMVVLISPLACCAWLKTVSEASRSPCGPCWAYLGDRLQGRVGVRDGQHPVDVGAGQRAGRRGGPDLGDQI